MKFLKRLVIASVLLGLAGALTAALAAPPITPPWYEVVVNQAGVAQGTPNPAYIVILTDVGGAFTERWYRVDLQIANQTLATALTAQATGKHARVYIENIAAGQPVLRFYLMQ